MGIFGFKAPAEYTKAKASKRKIQRIEKEQFESLGKTPTKRTMKRVIFDEPQQKAPAKPPKNWDIVDEPITAKKPKKVSKGANIRNRYNQVPHLTQDTNRKVTNSQLDTTNESNKQLKF